MRVFMREVVDLDKPVNLQTLGPFERIVVSLKDWFRKTPRYAKYKQKQAVKAYKEKVEKEELLKSLILSNIKSELVDNNEMGSRGWTCECIKLKISRSFEDTLNDIKSHTDFISYPIKIEPCDHDLLLSYENLPIIISIRPRDGGEELYEKN